MPARLNRLYFGNGCLATQGTSSAEVIPDWVLALTDDTWTIFDGIGAATNLINAQVTVADQPEAYAMSALESTNALMLNNWGGKGWFDKTVTPTGRIGFCGNAEGFSGETPAGLHGKALDCDLATKAWTQVWRPFTAAVGSNIGVGHVYDSDCSIALAGKVFRKIYNQSYVMAKDLATSTWSVFLQPSDFSGIANLSQVMHLEVHPTLGPNGSIVLSDSETNNQFIIFDAVTKARTTLAWGADLENYPMMHWVPALNGIVVGGGVLGGNTWKLLTSAGTFSALPADAFPAGVTVMSCGNSEGPMCADPSGQARSWNISKDTNKLYSIDWTTGAWTDHGSIPTPANAEWRTMVAMHGWGVIAFILGGGRSGGQTQSKFWVRRVT